MGAGSRRTVSGRRPRPPRLGHVSRQRRLVCSADRCGVAVADVLDHRLLQERAVTCSRPVPEAAGGWTRLVDLEGRVRCVSLSGSSAITEAGSLTWPASSESRLPSGDGTGGDQPNGSVRRRGAFCTRTQSQQLGWDLMRASSLRTVARSEEEGDSVSETESARAASGQPPWVAIGATRERKGGMTGKADFTEDEWQVVLEGPPSAGMIVVTAQRGGTFRETIAIAKAYVEARQRHGESELLDEIVSAKPETDHTRYHSVEELKEHGLQHLRDAVELLERKATPEELDDYKRFVLNLADKVATAHREDGESVSAAERAAIEEIAASLGTTAP